jgi:hypothetical protein
MINLSKRYQPITSKDSVSQKSPFHKILLEWSRVLFSGYPQWVRTSARRIPTTLPDYKLEVLCPPGTRSPIRELFSFIAGLSPAAISSEMKPDILPDLHKDQSPQFLKFCSSDTRWNRQDRFILTCTR